MPHTKKEIITPSHNSNQLQAVSTQLRISQELLAKLGGENQVPVNLTLTQEFNMCRLISASGKPQKIM